MATWALSVLSSNEIETSIKKALNTNHNWIHYDVMDGIFVPKTFFTINEIENLLNTMPPHIVDIHLMCEDPILYIEKFIERSNYISIHYEIGEAKVLKILKQFSHHMKIGIAINLETSVDQILPLLSYVSHILIMSVKPGQGGQKFNESVILKIKKLRDILSNLSHKPFIQVDGGIEQKWFDKLSTIGADNLVSGTYLLNKIENQKK